MKKMMLSAWVYLLAATIPYENARAVESASVIKTTNTTATTVENYIDNVYAQIDFGPYKKMDKDVFEKALYGYLNLQNAGKLNNGKNLLTIADMSKSSTQHRLWVIDLDQKKVLVNDYVAHGQGSGDEFATQFSNTNQSHQTSLGFYVTDATYSGKHGLSLHLRGMDQGYNNAAYERDVVVHGAAYVSDAFVAGQGKLGRSWGCPAVSNELAPRLINMIKDGTCLFIYYPQKQYLQSAYWLNKKLDNVPGINNNNFQLQDSAVSVNQTANT
jgi:hypothetical protein